MVIKLTRDVEVGRMGEVIDLPYQRATYLIRMGAALEWKQTADVDDVKEGKTKEIEKKMVEKETVKKVTLNGSDNKKRTINKK